MSLGEAHRRSKDTLRAIESEEDIKRAAIEASAQLKKARYFFEQVQIVGEEIEPILYYYGGIYFFGLHMLKSGQTRVAPPDTGFP